MGGDGGGESECVSVVVVVVDVAAAALGFMIVLGLCLVSFQGHIACHLT